jgi:amino acid transporter
MEAGGSVSSSGPGQGPARGLERRAVGLPTAMSTVFGLIVASTVLLSVGQGFSASWIFLVAIGLGLLTMYMQALSFSELATMIPKAGSMNEYVRAGLGAFAGSLTALMGYIAIMVFPTAAESLLPAIIITDFLEVAGDPKLWVAIIVVAVALLNVLGIRPFAAVEVLLTALVALSLLVFGVIGIFGLGTNETVGPALPTIDFEWSILTGLLGLAIFAFVGLEYTCPLAEELENPRRDLPLGMFLGLALIAVPLVLYGIGATRYVDATELADPEALTHMTIAIAMLGETGKWWMAIVSIAATVATLNALLAGIPRLLYGMSYTNQAPRVFGYLLPRTRAPVAGIAVMAIIPIFMNVTEIAAGGSFIELILAGVLGWATAYILIHISLISLRIREPNAVRPFRSPLFPLPQVIGIGLLVWAAVEIFPEPEVRDNIYRDYLVFLVISVVVAFVYNAVTMKSVGAQFRPIPLKEVYAEVEHIEEVDRDLPEDPRADTLAKP